MLKAWFTFIVIDKKTDTLVFDGHIKAKDESEVKKILVWLSWKLKVKGVSGRYSAKAIPIMWTRGSGEKSNLGAYGNTAIYSKDWIQIDRMKLIEMLVSRAKK